MNVYKITIAEQYHYFGIAKNIKARITRHIKALKKNVHHNIVMQRIWNKNQQLNYEILFSNITVEEAKQKEIELIKTKKCINIAKGGNGGDTLTNNPNKEQIIAKIAKNHYSNYSPEWFASQGTMINHGHILWGEYECPKCLKKIKGKGNFMRYHGKNCGIKSIIVCPHCGKIGSHIASMTYRHFDNCKQRKI